ncbi:TetR family transcriptional regulator [Azorhizobium oxalatiphilum]|uniref:TetR family transcriptional regulator n=1 Tax=Azorhizobium oxalatiphilum TaxID=980631 RepID=A0A917FFV3_9HYPH|nr:TetR/AcrR family transcriptional regulator [Azorhizobium oxalatiphilum]GGF81118.1 TetR family transcriptional regulator [Azorhizobium oxalatiphilum]
MQNLTRRALDKAARRADILAAALTVFAANGFASARLDDVAREAGIAKGTLYLYFADKQALFEGLIKENLAPIPVMADDVISIFEDTTENLIRALAGMLLARIQTPDVRQVMQLMIADGYRFPELVAFHYREVVTPGLAAITAIVKRGIARGEIRDTPESAALLRHPQMLFAPFLTIVVWNMTFHEIAPLDEHQFAEDYITLLLGGLRAGEQA